MSESKPTPIMLRQIVMWVCDPCLKGEGEECHTPGCALWLHRVDFPIAPEAYIELEAQEALS